MSSTQYIKIFNDTVLKQSILQGYETQRTNSTLGKFTMGELAFTRDTGRVFVGTYTDDKKSSDIPYVIDDEPNPGGLLVGNKYYGSSGDGKTPEKYTHYPSYNSKYGLYNGDYTFDKTTCSLMLFDKTITKSNKVTDDIYDDGFIRMKILEPDGITIMYDSDKTTHNVLKADFKFERVSKYFGENWTIDNTNEKIKIKNINLSNDAICNLPSTVYFNSLTGITFKGEEAILTDFPSYLLCGEKSESKDKDGNTIERFNVSFKNFSDIINIVAGDGIKIEKDSPDETTNKPRIKISCTVTTTGSNPDENPDENPPSSTTPEATQTPWDIKDGYYYSGISRFSRNGTLVAAETYGNTKIIANKDANNGDNVVIEYDENLSAADKVTLDFIKNNYIGGLFNIGLNYLKSPLASFNTYTTNTQVNPTTVKNFSNLSGVETCIEDMYTPYNSQYPRIIPSHAQSIILQVSKSSNTTTTTTASVKLSNGAILFETNDNKFTTTVEVPLYIKMIWEKDDDDIYPQAVSYKYFNISFSNCTVKLLGYRV